jgi:phosphatidate phosphatase APP1
LETAITKYTILPLIGLQNQNKFWLEGHIVKVNQKLLHVKDKEKYWRNIVRVINSYMPGSINRRKLEIHFNGQVFHVLTNQYGLIKINLPLENGNKVRQEDFNFFLHKKGEKYRIELPEPFMQCFYSREHPAKGVISDIDDTILVTHTKNPLKKIRTLLVKNALKRKSVKEMHDLYQTFTSQDYSFFYVSNSEANLFPMIRLFLEHQKLPVGPIFLKSFKKWKNLFKRKKKKNRSTHKKEKIALLLEVFPRMKFILIGDDSQQDPEIYTSFARKFPERIEHIYIRNVKKIPSRTRIAEKQKLWEDYQIPMTFFNNPGDILKSGKIVINSH